MAKLSFIDTFHLGWIRRLKMRHFEVLGLIATIVLAVVPFILGCQKKEESTTALNPILTLAAWGEHTCGISANGSLYCWGRNSSGQLGVADVSTRIDPTKVDFKAKYSAVGTGASESCAITTAGALKCWGLNDNGQLGVGDTSISYTPKLSADSTTTYSAVTCGHNHCCGITSAGVLKCWGANTYGALGVGSTVDKYEPTVTDTGVVYTKASCGTGFCCGITDGSKLKCWGLNDESQIGDGSTTNRTSPVAVDAANSYSLVTCGRDHACAITTAGALKCWGSNTGGKLGTGNLTSSTTPTVIDSGVTYRSVAAGSYHTAGVTSTGQLRVWGYYVGATTYAISGSLYSLTPLPFETDRVFTNVVAGWDHTCALTANQILRCMGYNYWGQVGDNSRSVRKTMRTITN